MGLLEGVSGVTVASVSLQQDVATSYVTHGQGFAPLHC